MIGWAITQQMSILAEIVAAPGDSSGWSKGNGLSMPGDDVAC